MHCPGVFSSMQQRAELIRSQSQFLATPIPSRRAEYTVTFGSQNIGAPQQPRQYPCPECYLCSYAHFRKTCPLLRCTYCLTWGHGISNCPRKPLRQVQQSVPTERQLRRAEALLFSPNVPTAQINVMTTQ